MNTGQPPRMDDEDPFSAAADPCPPPQVSRRQRGGQQGRLDAAAECACSLLSRRDLLAGAVATPALLLAPTALAQTGPAFIPCVQPEQRPVPCRHRFCRHYGGSGDIHGR